jgi:uroporphyrinogen III methyltransferase/synthase
MNDAHNHNRRRKSAGTVYLVGAGPGDPELITVKGKRLLTECDALVYDNLITDELVVLLPENVERYYVGKKAGCHAMPQDDINALLVSLAGQGKNVVRLKGGDPFVFGRGGEEAAYLRRHGIRFEIVPGVTSGIAAPAYCGIPATDRSRAAAVIFVTGHRARENGRSTVSWDWLGKATDATIVIYMGVSELPGIVERLVKSGMDPNRPGALIERGTFSSQKIITGKLTELPQKAIEANIKPPALIVIGDVVDLRQHLHWFEGRPLFGLRVMVTRAADQSQEMYNRLRTLGAEVLAYPTVATSEYFHHNDWRNFDRITNKKRWLVFTSDTGVRYFVKQFIAQHRDLRKLAGYRIAAIGKWTAATLRRHHLATDFIPKEATLPGLATGLVELPDIDGATVVRIRGGREPGSFENTLDAAGAEVAKLQVFRTCHPDWPEGVKRKLFDFPPDVIIFTSRQSVDGFCQNLSEKEQRTLTAKALVSAVGPATRISLEEKEFTVGLEASRRSSASLIDDLVEHFSVRLISRNGKWRDLPVA